MFFIYFSRLNILNHETSIRTKLKKNVDIGNSTRDGQIKLRDKQAFILNTNSSSSFKNADNNIANEEKFIENPQIILDHIDEVFEQENSSNELKESYYDDIEYSNYYKNKVSSNIIGKLNEEESGFRIIGDNLYDESSSQNINNFVTIKKNSDLEDNLSINSFLNDSNFQSIDEIDNSFSTLTINYTTSVYESEKEIENSNLNKLTTNISENEDFIEKSHTVEIETIESTTYKTNLNSTNLATYPGNLKIIMLIVNFNDFKYIFYKKR